MKNLRSESLAEVQLVVQTLTDRIQSGLWAYDTRIPSERELAAEFRVSRSQVRLALDALDEKGLLDRVPNCRPTVRRPHSIRPHLAKAGKDQIAVWIPQNLEDPGAATILQGIRNALGPQRYSLVIGCPEEFGSKSELPFLEMLARTPSIAGAIVLPSGSDTRQAYASLHEKSFPLMFVDREPCSPHSFDLVGTNNIRAAENAVRHLIQLGHRRIAMVVNDEPASSVRDRYDGYYLAMHQAGLEANEAGEYRMPVGIGTDASKHAITIIQRMLSSQHPPTAIFAINDQTALHLSDAITSLNLQVPEDLSLVGFDWSLRWVPSGGHITTVCQHFDAIGRIAVDRLLEKIGNPDSQISRQILIEGSLVDKGSTATPSPKVCVRTH